jgi:hypothetical protein
VKVSRIRAKRGCQARAARNSSCKGRLKPQPARTGIEGSALAVDQQIDCSYLFALLDVTKVLGQPISQP